MPPRPRRNRAIAVRIDDEPPARKRRGRRAPPRPDSARACAAGSCWSHRRNASVTMAWARMACARHSAGAFGRLARQSVNATAMSDRERAPATSSAEDDVAEHAAGPGSPRTMPGQEQTSRNIREHARRAAAPTGDSGAAAPARRSASTTSSSSTMARAYKDRERERRSLGRRARHRAGACACSAYQAQAVNDLRRDGAERDAGPRGSAVFPSPLRARSLRVSAFRSNSSPTTIPRATTKVSRPMTGTSGLLRAIPLAQSTSLSA